MGAQNLGGKGLAFGVCRQTVLLSVLAGDQVQLRLQRGPVLGRDGDDKRVVQLQKPLSLVLERAVELGRRLVRHQKNNGLPATEAKGVDCAQQLLAHPLERLPGGCPSLVVAVLQRVNGSQHAPAAAVVVKIKINGARGREMGHGHLVRVRANHQTLDHRPHNLLVLGKVLDRARRVVEEEEHINGLTAAGEKRG